MRPIDIIAVVVLVAVAIYSIFFGGFKQEGLRKPPQTPPGDGIQVRRPKPQGLPLSEPDPTRDPVVAIPPSRKAPTNVIGTAFSIDSDGFWLTAKHVVDECKAVILVIDRDARRGARVHKINMHPVADVAMLQTSGGPPALKLDDRDLHVGQAGFSFGYPQGRPGDVRGRLMGRAMLKGAGRRRDGAPLLVWSEAERRPQGIDSLGGISGGPMVNEAGDIVGVTIASSIRRGRVITANLSSAQQILETAAQVPDFKSSYFGLQDTIDGQDFQSHGTAMRESLTVAQVICFADR